MLGEDTARTSPGDLLSISKCVWTTLDRKHFQSVRDALHFQLAWMWRQALWASERPEEPPQEPRPAQAETNEDAVGGTTGYAPRSLPEDGPDASPVLGGSINAPVLSLAAEPRGAGTQLRRPPGRASFVLSEQEPSGGRRLQEAPQQRGELVYVKGLG